MTGEFETSPWGGRPARYATPITPGLAHRGRQVAYIARVLGMPLFPHQQQIVDTATQLNPPGSWLTFRYQKVVLVLPRQTGKTTVTNPVLVDRAQWMPNRQILTTAQLGKDASARWSDLADRVEASPLVRHTRIKRGNGQEVLTFPNRSLVKPFAPGPTAGHGYSPETVLIDELWAFMAAEAEELKTGLLPAMQTKRDRQLWLISAAGTQQSEWLNEEIEQGRASVNDPTSKTAYFEWSADEDADPYDPRTWEFHPGLDGLITIDDLREASKPENNKRPAWLRNYMNRQSWSTETVVAIDLFDKLKGEQVTPNPSTIALSYDVAVDRSSSTIYAGWTDELGRTNVRVWKSDAGAEWVAELVAAAWSAGDVGMVCADDGGPARAVTKALRRAGVPVTTLPGRDAATAWTEWKAAVTDAGKPGATVLVHDGSQAVRDALEVAAEKRTGDLRTLDRTNSAGPIDALMAQVVAAWFAPQTGTIPIA